ncbi:DUF1039 domain-containing protein [Cupriavidus sp. AU9028]|uniref:DUF1039 domain-containing protein n=1 Tax=Cupriavidus sp. AU9028 TaxID=2871157 RepID=UPI001C97C3BE|nr:DUF1039 domain-containing protein [Cupriavidus sp. AU9028]MBY4897869.1 DUF1039 domain-containing protein [Cupriavidus sp. AU9028]
MNELPRETRRLLVELAFVAGNQRLLGEMPAFIRAIPLLVADLRDREICLAYLYMRSGDLTQAMACLGTRDDPAAVLMTALISAFGTPSSCARVVNAGKPTRH